VTQGINAAGWPRRSIGDAVKIAVASGKGGTGKTLVATSLAHVASQKGRVVLVDLDVEEPNCHVFFDLSGAASEPVRQMIPEVSNQLCSSCGLCSDVCTSNAIVSLPTGVLVFPELCRGCAACMELCPERAIAEGHKVIGRTVAAHAGELGLVFGELEVGQPAASPLIAATKSRAGRDVAARPAGDAAVAQHDEAPLTIYDAPPGTSCPVIEAVKDVDYVVVVAEPTRFGLHDLDLMVRTLAQLDVPCGVVVNKASAGSFSVEEYCAKAGIDVLLRMPWSRDVAAAYARSELVAAALPDTRALFEDLLDGLPVPSRAIPA